MKKTTKTLGLLMAVLMLGTLLTGMVVLRTIWSGLAALWSAVRMLIP